MSLIPGGQNDRILAIYQILPELEQFLRVTLENEQLSEEANAKREEFITKLEGLIKPPILPPRTKTGSILQSDSRQYGPPRQPVNISEQRAISWRMTPNPNQPASGPYQSRKRHNDGGSTEKEPGRPSFSSITEDTGIYEKIPSENGSGKYIDVNSLENDGKPPIPDRSSRVALLKPAVSERETQRHSLNENIRELYIRDLQDSDCSGPLKELREGTKYWYVLKNKKLYVFKDIQGPCSQVIDVGSCEVLSQKTDIRLSMPDFPPLILEAESEELHEQWTIALEKCKYEDLDEIMPEKYKINKPNTDEVFQDPDYELPVHVIEQVERIRQREAKSPTEVYVDMHGGDPPKPADDYVDPIKRIAFYESLENLKYDAELPPIPLSSDEEPLGDYDDKFVPNGHAAVDHSDNRLSGSFDAMTSSSEEDSEPPVLPPRPKERSNTEPPPYSINSSQINSLDRKATASLGRKLEKEVFFNDADALHVGVLHQRRVLAVWQKRYCKVKNESLLVFRNPDKDEKPALEISLQDLQFHVSDKETWRSHSFKVILPNMETYYFAAETHEQLVTWLDVLVKERERLKLGAKDGGIPNGSKDSLSPNAANDANDSGSACSSERRDFEEGSQYSSSESTASADSEASDQDEPEADRRKSLKKRSSFQKSQSQSRRLNQELELESTLYMEKAGKWQKCWCKIETTMLLVFASKSSKSSEFSITLLGSNLVVPPKSVFDQSPSYIIKIVLSDSEVVFLAKERREWKKWSTHIKKYAANVIENGEIIKDLPDLPSSLKDERKPRTKKKPTKNGTATLIDVSDVAGDRMQYTGQLLRLKDANDETGNDVFCEIRGGFFVLGNESALEDKIIESPVRKVRVDQRASEEHYFHVFELRVGSEMPIFLGVREKSELRQIVEILWLQNANVQGERGTLISDFVNQLKKQYNRRSITFDSQPKDLEKGDRPALLQYSGITRRNDEKASSDSEHIAFGVRKQSKSFDTKKQAKQGSKQSSGSRMSAFFRSLPRRKHKKYDFGDSVDGIPKMQFGGTVTEVKVGVNGTKQRILRHCKVSGKIFYAYEMTNDLKPVFKVPLRNATIEDSLPEKGDTKFVYTVSSMEDNSTFMFEVETEEDFDNWYNALYMIDNKSNPGKMSSRESLLDEVKSDADIDLKVEISAPPFSGSNSNSSLSSVLSKQARSLAGSGDDSKAEAAPTRKVSEEVFVGGAEAIKHSGFLFQVKQSETDGIKTRSKIRVWCVVRQACVELYASKNDKVPFRGISIGHYSAEPMSTEESNEKWAIALRSEKEVLIFCASNEEEYIKWQQELKKVAKKRTRRSSDLAKLRLRSAGDGIKQLLSSSSLPGLTKRDSKRSTIVLDETDEKLVHDFTVDIESGNKISGILTITLVNEKAVTPKKRFCLIRDGKFCIAKRSKPHKYIRTIDLSKVAILDECDIDKGVFGFRLDFGAGECIAFQAADRKTADDWMVAISMAMLLERLTSPEKFPQHGEDPGEALGTDEDFSPGVDEHGLIDMSPFIAKPGRGSESSNLSNDIKAAIELKIIDGDDYFSPLSHLLESAFTPGPYSGSSTQSSREGTLERDANGRILERDMNGRSSSGCVIPEEDQEEQDGDSYSPSLVNQPSKNDISKPGNNPADKNSDSMDIENEKPRPGSVSKAIASFESRDARSRQATDDGVFHNEADSSQVEEKLADLLQRQEDLEKERSTILMRLPDLKSEVASARERRDKGSASTERHILEEGYETTKHDLERMERRLHRIEKDIKVVKHALQKKASKLKDPFRRRSAVISPSINV